MEKDIQPFVIPIIGEFSVMSDRKPVSWLKFEDFEFNNKTITGIKEIEPGVYEIIKQP